MVCANFICKHSTCKVTPYIKEPPRAPYSVTQLGETMQMFPTARTYITSAADIFDNLIHNSLSR